MVARGVAVLVIVLAMQVSAPAVRPAFWDLGDVPGRDGSNEALGVSADGSVVVGRTVRGGGSSYPFIWTEAAGMTVLASPGGNNIGEANAISDDGTVVVGFCDFEPFRWTAQTGMVYLGSLPGGLDSGKAYGMSADGTVVVGSSRIDWDYYRAFYWTQATDMVDLGAPAADQHSFAYAASADGAVIVGQHGSNLAGYGAFRWTAGTGRVDLGHLDDDSIYTAAMDVSADGTVVVGQSWGGLGQEAFRWTQAGGMIPLGDFPGGAYFSHAKAVSANGEVVVGRSADESSGAPFLWDSVNGLRDLTDILTDAGVDLSDWDLLSAEAISGDSYETGYFIAGSAFNTDGTQKAFLALVPEPATLMLLSVGAVAALGRRRKR
ncbi:hypothetical protein LCGC14_2081740 [marine sediment metagenome]|uniref:Ice-binding protein C-terminal domain-containing protein n=1 Tax=marine sediment metagenome TaxID=412755 RepID=A0A0F9F2U5_9ZZZZ